MCRARSSAAEAVPSELYSSCTITLCHKPTIRCRYLLCAAGPLLSFHSTLVGPIGTTCGEFDTSAGKRSHQTVSAHEDKMSVFCTFALNNAPGCCCYSLSTAAPDFTLHRVIERPTRTVRAKFGARADKNSAKHESGSSQMIIFFSTVPIPRLMYVSQYWPRRAWIC